MARSISNDAEKSNVRCVFCKGKCTFLFCNSEINNGKFFDVLSKRWKEIYGKKMEEIKMEKRKNNTVLHFVICVGLLVVIWGGYYYASHYGIDRVFEVRESDFSWIYQVDSVRTEGGIFTLQGFAFELDKNAENGSFEVVLQEIESGEIFFPKMEYTKRKDINDYFLCEKVYLESGFVATIKSQKLNLEEKDYEVLLKISDKRVAYQTGIYISNGELMYVNPTRFEPLDVEGTDLEEIVENGVLRVYRPDYGMYVYQYEGELYWIAEPDYEFVDGNTRLQLLLITTQYDKMMEDSISNGTKAGEHSFWFSHNEIKELDTGKYRVAKKEIPTDYSVARLQTGNWKDDKGWAWKNIFFPRYEFEDEK